MTWEQNRVHKKPYESQVVIECVLIVSFYSWLASHTSDCELWGVIGGSQSNLLAVYIELNIHEHVIHGYRELILCTIGSVLLVCAKKFELSTLLQKCLGFDYWNLSHFSRFSEFDIIFFSQKQIFSKRRNMIEYELLQQMRYNKRL